MTGCLHLSHGRRRRDEKCQMDHLWQGPHCGDSHPPAPCVLPHDNPLHCAEEDCPWRDGDTPKIKVHPARRSDIDLRSHAVQEGHLVSIRLGYKIP